MGGLVVQTAEGAARRVTSSYYLSRPTCPPCKRSFTPDTTFILDRGMVGFNEADSFVRFLEGVGCDFAPLPYRNGLLQLWEEKNLDDIVSVAGYPSILGSRTVIAGHSSGGFEAVFYGAIRAARRFEKTDDSRSLREDRGVMRIWNNFQELKVHPVERYRELGDRLEEAVLIGIASPLNGIHMNRMGRVVNRTVVEPFHPGYFTGVTVEKVNRFYDQLGWRPEEVLDGNIYSEAYPSRPNGDSPYLGHLARGGTALFHHLMNGTLNGKNPADLEPLVIGILEFFSRFVDFEGPCDPIVPTSSAKLRNAPNVVQRSTQLDHLKIVETEEGAQLVWEMVQEIRERRALSQAKAVTRS